jgi:translation initiation factor 2B subunit (eIF-2B alpha/beta/delta family)
VVSIRNDAAIDTGIRALASDSIHGSGYLARKALGILSLTPIEQRDEVAARLVELRPEMPAIRAAVTEALAAGDIRKVIRRADAERRRVARAAMRALSRRRVATISNSSLVARALVYASPVLVQVAVDGPDDEGYALIKDLRTAGIAAVSIGIDLAELDSEIAVVGCDAVFDDGSFVNRRGTATLVARLPTLVLVDRWKRVDLPPPAGWSRPELFEIVPGDAVRAPA